MKKYVKRTVRVVLAVLLAIQMMFVSGIKAFAATETPIVPIDEPRVRITGLNLILDGEIGLVYYVYVPDSYEDGYIELCKDNKEDMVALSLSDCDLDDNNRYMAHYYLSAIELSENVHIIVYDKDHTALTKDMAWSAEEYVKELLDEGKATEKEENIARTLINYGHYAQLACSEENGWVIGEDYAETTAFYAPTADTSVFDDYDVEWSSHTADFNHFSMSLRLDYKIGILLFIPVEKKPYVTVNGVEVEAELSKRVKDTYEIEIEGINALNLEDEYKVTINDVTITLCAFSYCRYNITPKTIDAMRALYEFYEATAAYNTPNTEAAQ